MVNNPESMKHTPLTFHVKVKEANEIVKAENIKMVNDPTEPLNKRAIIFFVGRQPR